MLTDTKSEKIRQTIDDMKEAEDALNVIMGGLPTIPLNDALYTVITYLRTGIETLQYIDRHLARGKE